MDVRREFSADDVTRPSNYLNDLGNIIGLPAVRVDAEPRQIVSTLVDTLIRMLRVSFVFVRLSDSEGGRSTEMLQVVDTVGGMDSSQGEALPRPLSLAASVGEVDLSVASACLGLRGEIGIIVAGSQRPDFPTQTEKLLLDVAASQATIGLQQAYLAEQRRVTAELDERVAQRTRELALANEALREREHDSRLLVHTIPGLVAIMTPAGEVDVVNDELVEYCGQPLEAMKQWGTNGTVHTDDLPRVGQVFTQPITSGDSYDFEARIRRFDGVYHWCQVRGLPFRDPSGRILRWYVLLSDIDDRKRAENALRESERESRLIVDCIPGLVAAFTPSGEVEFVNQQVLEYFGRTLEELQRWGTGGTTHPEDLPRVVELFSHSMAAGEPFEFEVRALRFDGVYRWFQSRGLPLRDTNARIVRWYNLLIDIDERKRAEQLLAEEKRFLEMVARGDSMSAILEALCQLVETTASGCYCSVVLVDSSGTRLEYGVAPSLPASFIASIIGRPVNAEAGPSAMAAYLNEQVISADLTSETRWAQYGWCPMALAHGLRACWATPITSTAGKVLGAFALYYDEPKRPTSIQQTLIQQFTHIASIAVERAQSDASLTRSEARKAAILDSALDCIVTIDHEGCITEFNPAAERTFGYRRDEVLGRQLADVIIPPALRESHRQGFARYLGTGEARVLGRRIEMTAVRADGSEFPAELAITRIPLDGPPSFTGYLRDITERKQSEEELRRSEAFLAQGQSLTLTGSLWWDVSTGEVTWSAETFRVMEVPKSIKPTVELALNRVHPDDLDLVREMVDRSAREGANMDFEPRLVMPDGSVKHVHVVLQNIGQPGKPEFVGAVTDITERKRAEAELRRAYDHLTEAQRLSQTGSFTADLERDEHFWSDEFYRICGFEPGSPVTIQRLGEVVHPEDVALYEGAIGRAMAGTDPDFYFRIVTARGVVKHLRGFAHRIADRPVFVGAVQDVTASKMAQEALNRAGAELAQVSRATALSALTASIAHEVNQPLSGIITNAGTCLRMLDAAPPDIDGARETARRTIRDGNRASDVITRLRALFSKREFALEPLDLNEATREVIALSSNDLQRNRIILQSELADNLPIVTGDRIQLQQVILNLLRNAADAMVDVHDRPRQLLIQTGPEDRDRVRVSVRDAGVGLAPESIDSLFDAFYTTKSGGMGIGLFVSRSIVEKHQGRLWAQPNDGPGATFSFSIPFQTV